MPTIFYYGPKLDKEKSREMIKSFAETAGRLTGIEKSEFVVYIRESGPENVGTGGEVLGDRFITKQPTGSVQAKTHIIDKWHPLVYHFDAKDPVILTIDPGDIVIARIGATTGKSYFVTKTVHAVFASYLIRIRTKTNLLPEYLYYFTKSQRVN